MEHNEELNVAEHLLGLPLKHRHRDLKGVGPDDHHRRWGWADEQSWHQSFFFPYSYNSKIDGGSADGWIRYSGNPILQKGAAGNWDSLLAFNNGMLLVDDVYYLYYAGAISEPISDNSKIGLATSSDGFSFFRYGTDGKIIDPPSGYKSLWVGDVLYDDYESDSNKKWKMLVRAMRSGTGTQPKDCLYFYSGDGKSWTYDSAISGGFTDWSDCPCFIRVGNAYFIYYEDTTGAIRLVVTKDFSTFHNCGQVLTKGAVGEWDNMNIRYVSIFWNLGVWYLMYSGRIISTLEWKIGMAVSSNGWSFTKYPLNPVFQESGVIGA